MAEVDISNLSPKWRFGTSAPASGSWNQGDIVWNREPSAEGDLGWVCVSSGSPGTWKAFGGVAA